MRKKYRPQILTLLLLFSFCFYGLLGQDKVRINEFMAINDQTLADQDGQFSDWIELYNPGAQDVSLKEWSLTDDSTDLQKWMFPDLSLAPGEYLLIFASGNNLVQSKEELHTNFKLSGAGEYLALVGPQDELSTTFKPLYPPQQPDISYGFFDASYVFFTNPTPGYDNSQEGALLTPPQITVNHGIFENPFDIEIRTKGEDTEIFYTTDGSTPDISNGSYYTTSIHIDTTTILRAVAVLNDKLYSNVVTRSYIFPGNVVNQPNDPAGYPSKWGPYTAISGSAIADYEMDPEMLSDPAFKSAVIESLKNLPTMSLVTDRDHLFSQSIDQETGGIYIYTGPPLNNVDVGLGRGWERPASIEFFDMEGTESFQVNCGLRLQGGHSRRPEKSPKHSFRLVFKSEYGPTKLNYPLFQDEDAATSFNSLILRAGFGLSWIHHSNNERQQAQYQRDIWGKDTQRDLGHPSSHSEYVHLYINGIYWGIYAPSERMDSDFAASYMKGDPDDFDVIKDFQDVANGEIDAWNRLFEMANAGLADQESYQMIQGNNPDGSYNPAYESLLDVDNLIDYMLINCYAGNTDWDHHNWAVTRNRVEPGSGFKFLCWDNEHMLKDVSINVLNNNNDNCPSRLFQLLQENEEFRRLLADRVQNLCFSGGLLTPEANAERWSKRTVQVESAINAEAARWGDYRRDVHQFQASGPFDLYTHEDYWIPQQSYMLNTYFPDRTAAFVDQLRTAGLYPLIDAPRFYINEEPYPVSVVSKGDQLSFSSEEGIIYYTENGKDPAEWGLSANGRQFEFIASDATKYVTVPKSYSGKQWYSDPLFDHGSWEVCSGAPGGIGYEKEDGYQEQITLDVGNDMYTGGDNPNTSCYVRIPFTVEPGILSETVSLLLSMKYDDGFAAFLNGVRVAEDNAPFVMQWNSMASGVHEASSDISFDLSEYIDLLQEGENMLAIHALNAKITSSDFLVSAKLIAGDQLLGGISEDAQIYSEAIALEKSVHIKARTYLDGSWSAAMSSFFTFPEDYQDLKLTEIHYKPLDEGDKAGAGFEFVELKNTGVSTLNLENLSFAEGIEFTFPTETGLEAGGFVVLASDEANFYERYGFKPTGEYEGNLNNGGDKLRLEGPDGDTLLVFLYDNDPPWPDLAGSSGYSLVPLVFNPLGDQNGYQNWRDSYQLGGSPGRDDTESTYAEETKEEIGRSHLGQNYPNPFTDLTYITYSLADEAQVDISVYNLMGQKVAVLLSSTQRAGSHLLTWNGADAANYPLKEGLYFYRMIIKDRHGEQVFSRKMIRY